MYIVVDWETGKELAKYDDLGKSKRECRKLGCIFHRGEYMPIAFVSDGTKVFGRYAVNYNPRFKTPKASEIKNYDEIFKE